MADAVNCSVCGKKFSGFMSVKTVCDSTKRDFLAYGKDVSCICEKCCFSLKENLLKETEIQKKIISENIESARKYLLDKIYISTTSIDHKYDSKIKGIVTGYSVVGTGPLVEFTSPFIDFLGKESGGYLKKIHQGETSAINMAKLKAIKMGANFIFGANISITEATKGNGMIMVSFVGTAVQTEDKLDSLSNYNEMLQEKNRLDSLPEITIAGDEEEYKRKTAIVS